MPVRSWGSYPLCSPLTSPGDFLRIQSCTWTSLKSMKGEAQDGRCCTHPKITWAVKKGVKVSEQSTNMLESPTFWGTASICAGYDSCRASRTVHKKASAGQSRKHLIQLPSPGLLWRAIPQDPRKGTLTRCWMKAHTAAASNPPFLHACRPP